MPYSVRAKRGPQQDHWQPTHTSHLVGMGGRPYPQNISGLQQPFPYPHDWRGRAGIGFTPGPRAVHARDMDLYGGGWA